MMSYKSQLEEQMWHESEGDYTFSLFWMPFYGSPSGATRLIQRLRDDGLRAGTVLLPERICSRIKWENRHTSRATAAFWGANRLVPEDIDVLVLAPAGNVSADSPDRSGSGCLADTPCLLDLAYGGDALYSPDEISCRVMDASPTSKKVLALPELAWSSPTLAGRLSTPFARAVSSYIGLQAQEMLLSPRTDPFRDANVSISRYVGALHRANGGASHRGCEQATDEAIEEALDVRRRAFDALSWRWSVLTQGMMGGFPFDFGRTADLLADVAAAPFDENGYGWFGLGWDTGSGRLVKAGTRDDLVLIDEEAWSALDGDMVAAFVSSDDRAEIEEMLSMRRRIEELRDIWQEPLRALNSPFSMFSLFENRAETDEERALASEAFAEIARIYGIAPRIDAYASGVPLEDILA